ncbi:MAG: hypothetical protein ACOY3J_02915 [Bacillota bacterium]|uniref:Uncharacterized protein n=1 Tax=Thermanaerosceptrum fracticalcis TaxID=1712410 RepID=A0A7G6E135_THEFR|nr:hypothetical protein [Thermanaerosceptrum fracticalcis]QNB45789.1 hypothetical protein BR63_05350 [Thermanaerosceptrum fracticalcis]
MILLSLALMFTGFYLLKILIVPPVLYKVSPVLIWFIFSIVLVISFSLSIRLWKWYDRILNIFSKKLRVVDILTWAITLWVCIDLFRDEYLRLGQVLLKIGTENVSLAYLPLYANLYTWGGLTSLGFMIIGLLRIFINDNILQD